MINSKGLFQLLIACWIAYGSQALAADGTPLPAASRAAAASITTPAIPVPTPSTAAVTPAVAQSAASAPTAAPAPPPTPIFSIAHSALLIIEATPVNDSLAFHIRRVSDQKPVVVANDGDVAVTLDGKKEPVTRESDGSYRVPADDFHGKDLRSIDVIVAHDGIREILSGTVALPESTATSLWRDHTQVAWWILNITIVLIAAIVISRRKG